jgi:hypothetical protein
MKLLVLFVLLAFGQVRATARNSDRTITRVVKLLQEMLEKSQTEGNEERTIYAKFKCYCDQSEAEKRASIEQLTKQIEVLESEIERIQGDSGVLSSECAQLKADMAENEQARNDATGLRKKENTAFLAEETDLSGAIDQMKEAIEVLSEVGADQTHSTGAADNKKFMAGYGSDSTTLLSLQSRVRDALKAASAMMSPKQRSAASAFVQAPFTGTYTAQSGEVVGILKDMRDTFETNLASARDTEKKALAAYEAYMKIKQDAYDSMSASYEEKQKSLGDNDGELSSKKKALEEARNQLASDNEFLDKLLPLCSDKTKSYENRKVMRAQEEAAIAEAISILNSDAAFATFGTVTATSDAKLPPLKFIQMRSVRRHETGESRMRGLAKKLLEQASAKAHSARLAKVVALLNAENPFTTVLEEINKMLDLIKEEGEVDKKNLDWCNSERDTNNEELKTKNQEIVSLEESINKLDGIINEPETGLKALIAQTETALVQNTESQKTETAERTENNLAYQADVRNLVDAQGILKKAIKVLKAYYDDLEKKLAAGAAALMQEEPNAPDTWSAYEGQKGQGTDVISMLDYILDESHKEETEAHSEEEKSQAAYEDSMTTLKQEEADAQKNLAKLNDELAQKEKELLDTKEDLKRTTADRDAIKAYLAQIKPGCDFITTNFDTREANRATEKGALEKAVGLIKDTPAYKTAVAEAKVESFGKCKEPCTADEADVECKACMADVTIPAYCAGHAGTKGC